MKIFNNILKVVGSNLVSILSGVFVGFLLPKVISVSDFGFYKIFTLYFNYLGILSLGIIDGIVLRYGGKNYDELEPSKFRWYFLCYFTLNAVFTVIIALTALLFDKLDYRYIVVMLAINLLPINITGYLQQISQITQRFGEYSKIKILQSLSNVVLILFMYIAYVSKRFSITYRFYLVGFSLVNLVISLWYVKTYKAICVGYNKNSNNSIHEIYELAKYGFPLLLANLCSMLMLSLDRQFVSILFTTEEYATYAFAYSMLSLITVATSAISTVFYPLFKRIDLDKLKANYSNINFIIIDFVFIVILCYFPLCYFIKWFLPQYEYSLLIFRIILPGLAVSTAITVVMQNYYKVLEKNKEFFRLSVYALIIAFVFNIAAYFIFRSRESITIVSIIALLIWYFLVEKKLKGICSMNCKNTSLLLINGICFYVLSGMNCHWLGGILYISIVCFVSYVLYHKDFKEIMALLAK